MKLISLTQPWAALVAHGFKRFETRGWSTDYRGPLAIHATKGPADPAAMHRLSRLYPEVFARLDLLGEHGTILAVADLEGCYQMRHKEGMVPGTRLTAESLVFTTPGFEGPVDFHREVDFGDWRVGRSALDLRVVRRVAPHAIPRGSQGRPIPLDPLIEGALRYL